MDVNPLVAVVADADEREDSAGAEGFGTPASDLGSKIISIWQGDELYGLMWP